MTAGCAPPPSDVPSIKPYRPGFFERALFPNKAPKRAKVVHPRRHVPVPQGPLETVLVRLERTVCFGTCPAYSVELRGTGEVVYQGGCFTMVPGRHVKQVDPQVVAALVEQFRNTDFWSLREVYRAQITDHPTYRVTLSIDGQTKTVEDYVGEAMGMPPEVSDLETAIDMAAGSARWISGDEPTLRALEASGVRFDTKEGARMLALAREHQREDIARFLLVRGAPESGPNAASTCPG